MDRDHKMMKHRNLFFVLLISAAALVAQQDAQYTQYMFTPLSLNPAYAGTRESMDMALLFRNQWTNMPGAPKNLNFTVQSPIGKKNAGVGAEFLHESIGPKTIGSIRLSYSYRIKLGPGKLSFGLKAGFNNYKYDWEAIKYRDQGDPYHQARGGQEAWMVISADFGMYYYTKSFYAGACATHLNGDNLYNLHDTLNEGTQVMHLFIPAGVGLQVSETFVINPSILVKMAPAAPVDIDVNCNFLIENKLWLGAGYRSKYGITALVMWNINEKMRMGYSYDYGLNRIGAFGRGSHELMLGYGLGWNSTKTLTPRFL